MATLFSRSGNTDPHGKKDQRLDILVSEELLDAIITMATLRRMSKSEFVRRVLEKTMFGEFVVMKRVDDQQDDRPQKEASKQAVKKELLEELIMALRISDHD